MLEKPRRKINAQLPLAIHLNDEAQLVDFCWGNNSLLQKIVLNTLDSPQERFLTIWGNSGSGKSHLLQAGCQAIGKDKTAAYLPIKLLKDWGPSCLEGFEENDFIALDDLHLIAGQDEWEEAIFHFYNKIRDNEKSVLMISSQFPIQNMKIQLPDLRSRLTWGITMQLHELDDHAKIEALQRYAEKRGFSLPKTVAEFLMNRCSRNMHDLQKILDQLDDASLAAHRKITIPFVKSTLNV